MTIHYKRKALPVALATASMIMVPVLSFAEDLLLEEIVVTATKRTESLADVPISVSVIDAQEMRTFNMSTYEDVSRYIPNFSVTKDPISDKINIRGIQSGENAGFEQSVGTFLDGIYHGRGVQSRLSFLDMETIEVLRGPQGVLYGKNTIAGAINIHTAKPEDVFGAELRSSYNFDFEKIEIGGYVTGPITDSLRARFAFLDTNQDKGWVENIAYDENGPTLDEQSFRLSLEWDAGENTTVSLRYDDSDWDNGSNAWVLSELGPFNAFGFPGLDDGDDYRTNMGNTAAPIEAIFGPGAAGDVTPIDFGTNHVFEGDSSEYALTVEHKLANEAMVTLIAGHSVYQFDRRFDADFSPLPILAFSEQESFDQDSIELRITSNNGGKFEYLAGVYWQHADLDTQALTTYNTIAALPVTGVACSAGGGVTVFDPARPPDVNAILTTLANFGNTSFSTANMCNINVSLQGLAFFGLPGFQRNNALDQDAETWAVFTQFSYSATDTLRFQLGLRYGEETKDAQQAAWGSEYVLGNTTPVVDPVTGELTTDPLTAFLITNALGSPLAETTTHAIDLSRDEDSFTWSATALWDATDDAMVYLTASTGFKSGGFNSFYLGSGEDPADAEFENEEVFSVEIGSKMSLLNGAAELNVAIFYTDYDDLQVSTLTGGTSFVVQNAASATTQGIELEGRWQLTEKLYLRGALGWVDFEFNEYPFATCTEAQLSSFLDQNWQSNPLTATMGASDCADAGVNDLKGSTNDHTPEYTASLIASYVHPIGDYELISTLAVNYRSDIFLRGDMDPIDSDGALTTVDLALAFLPMANNWEISLLVKNLTDETSRHFANDTPLFSGAHEVGLDAPRNVTLTGRYRF